MKESMTDDQGGFSSSSRRGCGRKKIPMKKIENKTSVQVTFSKRRSGLFKKAEELCLLCGAEVAVIAFSPGGKPFLFGNPSADAVIDRLNNSGGPVPGGRVLGRETLERPEVARGDTAGGNRHGFWWEAPESEIERMGLTQLERFGGALQELMNKAALRMMMESGSDTAAGSNFNHPGTSSTVESANSACLVLQDFNTKMEAQPECNSLCLDYTSNGGFCFDETPPFTKIYF